MAIPTVQRWSKRRPASQAILRGAGLLLALHLTAPSASAAAKIPNDWDSSRFISTAEIQAGMTGTGYTVFRGTEIEAFDVEVLGVLHNIGPGRDAIIARVSHPIVDKAGIIQGMSGSPVYLDGRLAGAVAFGWGFMTDPICGITPIQHMLPLVGLPGAEPQSMSAGAATPPAPLRLTAEQVGQLQDFAYEGAVDLPPLATAISLGGVSPAFLEVVKPWFAAAGLTPIAGGGTSDAYADVNPPLEPGSALALQLITGDVTASGIGTTTYVEGDHVLGFGHAFRYSGAVALPMGNAYIISVLSKQTMSAKLGVGLRTLGELTQDHNSGIAGTLGPAPEMVPLTVSVQAPATDGVVVHNFRVAPDRDLMPMLLATAGAGSVFEYYESSAPFYAQVDVTIHPRGHAPITSRSFSSRQGGASGPLGMELIGYLRALLNNPYGRLAIDSVDASVHVRKGLGVAYLEEVRPSAYTVRPGETLSVTLVYRRHEGGRSQGTASVSIPPTAKDGVYALVISDARRTLTLEQRRAPMRFRPTNLKQFLEVVDLDFPENELTLTLLSPRPGMAVHGQELAHLPGSVLDIMRTAAKRDLARPTRGTIVAQTTLPVDMVVNGAAMLSIRVDRHAP